MKSFISCLTLLVGAYTHFDHTSMHSSCFTSIKLAATFAQSADSGRPDCLSHDAGQKIRGALYLAERIL